MDQIPGPSTSTGEWLVDPDLVSQYTRQFHEDCRVNANLSMARIEAIRLAQNRPRLPPPPPDYHGSQLIDYSKPSTSKSNHDSNKDPNNSASSAKKPFIYKYVKVDTEVRMLCKWSVIVKNMKLDEEDTIFTIEISGTRLTSDFRRVIHPNHEAGRLQFLLSKTLLKTTKGLYQLVGPIASGYPNNLYRACLEANGIPKTWKYALTQFSEKSTGYNQSVMKRGNNSSNSPHIYNILIKGYSLIQKLLLITIRRLKQITAARKPIPFMRYHFQQKLIQSIKKIKDKIPENLKPVNNEL